jgi:hypothetical protein
MIQIHLMDQGQGQKQYHRLIEDRTNVPSSWLFGSLQEKSKLTDPNFIHSGPEKSFTAGQSFTVSAAGQVPCQHCPSATFHAQSAFGILADTAQEGAICAGDFIPPSGR